MRRQVVYVSTNQLTCVVSLGFDTSFSHFLCSVITILLGQAIHNPSFVAKLLLDDVNQLPGARLAFLTHHLQHQIIQSPIGQNRVNLIFEIVSVEAGEEPFGVSHSQLMKNISSYPSMDNVFRLVTSYNLF